MRIATVNVNGVRAAWRKGGREWFESSGVEVACLQEVRAPDAILRELMGGWNVAHDESAFAGRAGAAIASRSPLGDIVIGLADPAGAVEPTHTGRWVEATIETATGQVRVVSVYLHSGTVGTPSMDDKYAFLERATARLAFLAGAHERVVVAGDLNIAHTNADIKNWKANLKSAGVLPEERAYLDRWVEAGWVDVHRMLAGDRDGPYTWWSQRGKAFDNDVGWRIDYQFATRPLASLAREAVVPRAPTWDTRWSDHAPLVVDYDLG